jgi:hypothetical protein
MGTTGAAASYTENQHKKANEGEKFACDHGWVFSGQNEFGGLEAGEVLTQTLEVA